jgi:diguanylate cyclase (GGDEF)-like protein
MFADGSRARVITSSDHDADVVEVIVEGQSFLSACFEEKVAMKVIPKAEATPEVAVFQFRCSGDATYFVVCISPTWATPADEIDSRFRLLQAQVQMTGRNITNIRGVRHLVYLDEPTGLYNTRYLHLCLDQRFERYNKDGKGTFSVLFLDVDKFKGINDQFGHLVGTKLLHEMANIIRKTLRKTDVAFRYGGDEFVLLLDGMPTSMACAVGEKIRSEVERTKFLAKEALNVKLTVSIGVANCPEHAMSKRDIIDAADGAMYAVKRSSRNKVYIAEKKAA